MFDHFQDEAERLGRTLRDPPPPPISCCGRGCEGCVWLDWYEAAARWRREAEKVLSG